MTTTRTRTRAKALIAGAAGALVLGACSTDYSGGAADLIEEELSGQLGLGDLAAECEDPGDVEIGTSFACTATTEDGQVAEFTATVTDEDYVDVVSDNVVLASDMPALESIAAADLGASLGLELPADSFDCGDAAVIVTADTTIACTIVEPGTGDVYDATLSNIVLATDSVNFDIQVAEEPRS